MPHPHPQVIAVNNQILAADANRIEALNIGGHRGRLEGFTKECGYSGSLVVSAPVVSIGWAASPTDVDRNLSQLTSRLAQLGFRHVSHLTDHSLSTTPEGGGAELSSSSSLRVPRL